MEKWSKAYQEDEEVESVRRKDDKVARTSSCPNVTLSWQRVHRPPEVTVKRTTAVWEDYQNSVVRTPTARQPKWEPAKSDQAEKGNAIQVEQRVATEVARRK